jgi:hypothetical protein
MSMAAPELNAKEVLESIRSGMDDVTLMERYHLSPKGLQSLFRKMVAAGLLEQSDIDRRQRKKKPPSISLEEFVEDIRAGIDDERLKKKFLLSEEKLQKLFDKVMEKGLLSVEEFYARVPLATEVVEAPVPALPPMVDPAAEPEEGIRKPPPVKAPSPDKDLKMLINAAQEGRADRVAHFLDRGVDVNAKDRFGDSALIVAAERGHADVVTFLIQRGADVNITDAEGKTPGDWAVLRKHQAVMELLAAHGAKV